MALDNKWGQIYFPVGWYPPNCITCVPNGNVDWEGGPIGPGGGGGGGRGGGGGGGSGPKNKGDNTDDDNSSKDETKHS